MILHPSTNRHLYINPNQIQFFEVEEVENSKDTEYKYSYTLWIDLVVFTFLSKRYYNDNLNKDLGLIKDYRVTQMH